MSVAQAERLLIEAEQVLTGLVNLPHSRALRTATQFRISAYDARFIGAAQSLGRKLVTEDVKLRAAAPAATLSLIEAIDRA